MNDINFISDTSVLSFVLAPTNLKPSFILYSILVGKPFLFSLCQKANKAIIHMKKPISIVVKSSPTMNLSISAHFYFDIRILNLYLRSEHLQTVQIESIFI